jgi:RNA polymerase sigma factor (sigma-70 family)
MYERMAEPTTTDPKQLLEHATWLRRLALSLVGDGAIADDLVQETYVAALRRPPTADRPLRPWLRHVLKNLARFRWRGDTNRTVRERAAAEIADQEVPSSEALLERHETQQLLARLVTELEEPFRATILLRYAEGLEPSEIARRLGIPAATVRSRVKEGLERLRVRLDALHRGDRRAWVLALTPLAKVPSTSSSAASPLLVVLLVAIAATAVVWLAHTTSRNHGRAVARAEHDRLPASAPTRATELVTALAAGQPPGWLAQEGAPRRRIAGRVVEDGTPAGNVLVRVTSELSQAGLMPALEQRTKADGRFDFGDQVAREFTVGAAAAGKLAAIEHIDLRDPTSHPEAMELALRTCAAAFFGKVIDASGVPIAHAQVLREDAIGTESDPSGAYEICMPSTATLGSGLRIVVRADGFGGISLDASPSGRVHHDFVLTPEASVSGLAFARDGRPVANAEIWIEPEVYGTRPMSERAALIITATDADGRFHLVGVSGGRHRLNGVGLGVSAVPLVITVDAASSQDVVLHMVDTGIVRGHVVTSGRPVAGAQITMGNNGLTTAVSQTDGSFVFDALPIGEVQLTTAPFGIRSPRSVTVVAGDRNNVVLEVVPLAVVRGTVRRHGLPVPFARIGINGPSKVGTTTDAAGHYELAGLEPGTYGLLADDTRLGAYIADVTLSLGLGEQRDFDVELAWGARIAGVVVDGHGAPVPGVLVRWNRGDGDEGRCVTATAGTFDCGSMAGGGSYQPAVYSGEDASIPFPFVGAAPPRLVISDGDARVDGIRLVIDPEQRTIRGKVVDTSGTPIADARVRAVASGADTLMWRPTPIGVTDTEGGFRIDHLAPGDYSLTVETLDGAKSAQRTVAAGTLDATLVVDRPNCATARNTVLHETPSDIPFKPNGNVIWDGRIQLLGWNIPRSVRLGESFEVTLYYKVLQPIDRSWKIFMHFDGSKFRHNGDHEPADGRCPTSAWQPGDIVVDRFTTSVSTDKIPNINPGNYEVTTGLFTGWNPSWKNMPISEAPKDLRDSWDGNGIKIGVLNVE